MSWRFHAAFAVVASIVVAMVVGWGFVLVGSPGTRRMERFDEDRLRDLQAIAREIQDLVAESDGGKNTLKEPLPKTLEELARRARGQRVELSDPETGEPYGYNVKGESTFEVCAEFMQPRDADYSVFWNHPAGQHCFTIDVLDPPPLY